MSEQATSKDLLQITGLIVSGYVKGQRVPEEGLSSVINRVFYALHDLNRQGNILKKVGPLVPAVPVEESVHDDYIICLEDGKQLQMLKRHLNTTYNMTLEQYRERWGLAPDYPSVAPGYARRRSSIAKSTGLGMTGRSRRNSKTKKERSPENTTITV